MNEFMKMVCASVAALTTVGSLVEEADAGWVIHFSQDGPDVVATVSGTLDLTGGIRTSNDFTDSDEFGGNDTQLLNFELGNIDAYGATITSSGLTFLGPERSSFIESFGYEDDSIYVDGNTPLNGSVAAPDGEFRWSERTLNTIGLGSLSPTTPFTVATLNGGGDTIQLIATPDPSAIDFAPTEVQMLQSLPGRFIDSILFLGDGRFVYLDDGVPDGVGEWSYARDSGTRATIQLAWDSGWGGEGWFKLTYVSPGAGAYKLVEDAPFPDRFSTGNFDVDLLGMSGLAPSEEDFKAKIVGETISSIEFTSENRFRTGGDTGNWKYMVLAENVGEIVYTYDEDSNDPGVYREEDTLTFLTSSSGFVRSRHYVGNILQPLNTGDGETDAAGFSFPALDDDPYGVAIAEAGLTGANAEPTATPMNDGVPNLLKFAFNMNLSGADSHEMATDGTSGLPGGQLAEYGGQTYWRVQYVRRVGSGLIYTPKKSTTLAPGSFVPMTGASSEVVIDAEWVRVTIDEPCNPLATPTCFSHVEVTLP